ncbi:MAG: DUF2505 domain-containing protein [Jatrophihabitans sp.]
MKIEAQLHYSADCERVAEVTRDEAFQNRKCEATGALTHTVSITSNGDRTLIRTTRQMPTDDLPDFVRGLVRDGIHVTEVDDWGPPTADGSRDGTVEVTFAGAPIVMKGSLRLRPDGTGAVASLSADLKASIPLIGSRIEKACSQAVLAAISVEEHTAGEWLAEHP